MCRVIAYLGEPLLLDGPLFAARNSLVHQVVEPKWMSLLNIGGFGLAAWDSLSPDPERPYVYRTARVPVYDRNLKALAEKVRATAAIAHVRGVEYDPSEAVGPQNVHPFRFPGARVVLAQNGGLNRFAEMRYDLLDHIGPELARQIEGTTDTEWLYALVLSRLDAPFGPAPAEDLARAVSESLRVIRDVREQRGIDRQSAVNLVVSDGSSIVATRFCFDYGWYADRRSTYAGEREFDFTTLWYAACEAFAPGPAGWETRYGDGPPRAVLIASEALNDERTDWIEVPEYTMLVVTRSDTGVTVDVRELEL
jgi:glutamine amidotransferase